MKFSTSAEAFNFYQAMPTAILESRAQAIRNDVAQHPECDLDAYKAELDALKAIKESRANKPEPEKRSNLRLIDSTNHADDVFGTPEYRSAFFAQVMGRELTPEQRAVMESADVQRRSSEFNSSSNSLAVLPTQTLNEVVERAKDHGGIVSLARAFHIPSGLSIPVGGPGARAQWHVEGEPVDSEKYATTSVKFDAHELLRVFSLSAKVDTMGISAFEAAVIRELSDSVMEAIAYALVHGTGEGEGQGIETITWTQGKNLITTDGFQWRDLLKMIGMLHRGYAQGATVVCNNRTLYETIYSAFSDENVPVYLQNLQDSGSMRLVGFPIAIDDYAEDGTIYFGNFAKGLGFNLPSGIAVERSDHSGFRSGTIDFRGLAIADSRVILPEAFVKLQITE